MIINLLATWIPALGIGFLGVLKLLGNPRVAEEKSKVGVGRYLRLLGVMEIAARWLRAEPRPSVAWSRNDRRGADDAVRGPLLQEHHYPETLRAPVLIDGKIRVR
jgi:hypothetical protein